MKNLMDKLKPDRRPANINQDANQMATAQDQRNPIQKNEKQSNTITFNIILN